MRIASFLSLATFSREYRLLISAQSVTRNPSHCKSSFNHFVRYSYEAWTGTPFTDAEFTIIVNVPARAACLKGSKYFSRIISGLR